MELYNNNNIFFKDDFNIAIGNKYFLGFYSKETNDVFVFTHYSSIEHPVFTGDLYQGVIFDTLEDAQEKIDNEPLLKEKYQPIKLSDVLVPVYNLMTSGDKLNIMLTTQWYEKKFINIFDLDSNLFIDKDKANAQLNIEKAKAIAIHQEKIYKISKLTF